MKKRRTLKKIVKIFLVLILLTIALYIILNIKTKTIFIHNSTLLKDIEIIDNTSLKEEHSFFLITGDKIKEELNKKYIKDIKIKREFFLELHIYVEEYKPLFIKEANQMIVLENKEEVEQEKNISLPILINYIPDLKYEEFINKLKDIDDKILSKISEIKYDPNLYDEDRFLLYMNDKNKVYITLTKMELLNKYNEIVEKIDGNKGILYIDSGNYFEIKK